MAETSLHHMMNSAYILSIIRILLSTLSEKYVLGLHARSPALCAVLFRTPGWNCFEAEKCFTTE